MKEKEKELCLVSDCCKCGRTIPYLSYRNRCVLCNVRLTRKLDLELTEKLKMK